MVKAPFLRSTQQLCFAVERNGITETPFKIGLIAERAEGPTNANANNKSGLAHTFLKL